MKMEKRKNKLQKSAWRRLVSCMLALFLTVGGMLMSMVPVQATTMDDVTVEADTSETDTVEVDTVEAVETNASVNDPGKFAVSISSGGFYIDVEGLITLQEDTFPCYWKNDPDNPGKLIVGDASGYNLYYDSANNTLHLKDLNLSVKAGLDENGNAGNAIFSDIDLKLVLEGTNNKITCDGGVAVMTAGSLEITGSGNLEVTATPAEEDLSALFVGGNIEHNGTGTVTLNPSGDAAGIGWDENGLERPEITGNGTWKGKLLPPEEPAPLPETDAGRGIIIDDDGMHSEETNSSYYLNGDDGTVKTDGAGENNYNIKYVQEEDKNILYLKNLTLKTSEWTAGLVYVSTKELEIRLEGTNSITSDAIAMQLGIGDEPENSGNGVLVSKVSFSGTGTLNLTSGAVLDEDGTYYYASGLYVNSDVFANSAVINVTVNENAEAGALINASSEEGNVLNTGTLTVSNKKLIVGGIGATEGLSYKADIATHKLPETDTAIKEGATGKCYYFYEDKYYPNEHIDGIDKGIARIYGKYDENGNPIPSNIVIQKVTYDKYNVPVMDDWGKPEWWLVYEDDYKGNIDTIVKDIDIVSVCDGKKHTFNTDIYRAWIEAGDVTINGDITCDIALFEAPMLIGDKIYVRENGKIKFYRDSKNTKVTITGNVGFMSLSTSFDGSVTVNGKVDAVGLYDDVAVKDGKEPEETAVYGPYVSGTNIVASGKLSSKSNLIGGTSFNDSKLKGYGVYGGDLYVMTEGKEGSKEVKGTCNVLDGNPAVVSVSKDSVTGGSAPKVEDADAADKTKVETAIGAKKTYTAFDLSLIEDNKKAVQPVKKMDVYISNTEGYKNPVVCYVKPDGTLEQHQTQISNGKICFETNHLSTYVIVEADDLKKDEPTTATTEQATTEETAADAVVEQTTDVDKDANKDANKDKTPGTGDGFPIVWVIAILSMAGIGLLGLGMTDIRKKLR